MKEIAVVLRYPDYRGDHSTDSEKVLILSPDTPLKALLERVEQASEYGKAEIAIVLQEKP